MPNDLPESGLQRWPLWRRQLLAVMRLEIRRNLLHPGGLWIFFLAFAPAAVAMVYAVVARRSPLGIGEQDANVFAWMFQFYYLRLACFFGSLGFFIRQFRAEMQDKTLHYALLAPLRREILVVGKYLAASLGSTVVFGAGVAVCFAALHLQPNQFGESSLRADLLYRQLAAYLGVTALACIGYGAVFLSLTLLFRNPALAAIVYLGWESVSGMLPASLQLLSVTFYLKPLLPLALPVVGFSGLFTVVADPVPLWLAIGGPLVFSGVVVTLCALRFRRAEFDTAES